MLTSSELL